MRFLLALLLCGSLHAFETFGVAWFSREIPVSVVANGPVSRAEWKRLCRAATGAALSWSEAAGSLDFTTGDPCSGILIVYDVACSQPVSVATFTTSGNWINRATIFISPADVKNKKRLLPVLIHELGHALGLNHSSDSGAIMYRLVSAQSVISPDDIAGIKALYP